MNYTPAQIERQDYVDNQIFALIQELAPIEIEWDMEIIGEVRDHIEEYLAVVYGVPEREFYP